MVPPPSLLTDSALALALCLLAAAALSDVAFRRIPNGIAAALGLIGVVRHGAFGVAALGVALCAAATVGAAAAALWHRGLLGGGDVKLIAAAALLVPTASVPALLLAIPLAGGVLALAHLALRPVAGGFGARAVRGASVPRRLLRHEARRIARGAPLPYGVAIAAGAAFVIVLPGG